MRRWAPVPLEWLESALKDKTFRGEKYTEDDAVQSLVLDLVRGTERTKAGYARLWNWRRQSLYDHWDSLMKQAEEQRRFYKSEPENQPDTAEKGGHSGGHFADTSADTLRTQNPANQPENEESRTLCGHSGGHFADTSADNILIDVLDKEIDKREDKSANALSSESPPSVPFEDVMESWNAFAADVGLSKVVSLSTRRKAGVRARYRKIWPNIEMVYEEIRRSDFLLGITGNWGGATFDFVWCRTEGAAKILEGQYRNKGFSNGKRGKHSTDTANVIPLRSSARSTGTDGAGGRREDLERRYGGLIER